MASKAKDYAAGNQRLMNDDTGLPVGYDNPLSVSMAGNSVSAFGELLTATPFPLIQGDFVYSINPRIFRSVSNGGGSITNSSGMAVMTTGANANSLASIRSKRVIRYRPGQGAQARFTAMFDTPATGNTQTAGCGTAEAGLFFGYIDTYYCIIHNQTNTREQQSLQITTKSSNSQTAVVTLGGVAFNVAVTNGASATVTAWEIAQADYTAQFPGWQAFSIGDTVTFVCTAAGNQTGTFSCTFPTSGVGAFTEAVPGALGTTNVILQSSWNLDTMDGSGNSANPSGLTINPQKMNVYQVSYQYLGAGAITFSIEDQDSGAFVAVHRIKYANANIIPSLKNPGFPIQISSRNTTNTTAITVKSASVGAFLDGVYRHLGAHNSYLVTKTGITTALTPIFSIRPSLIYNSKVSTSEIVPTLLNYANIGGKGLEVYVIKNGTLNNSAAFTKAISATESIAEIDISATSVTGGSQILSLAIGNGNSDKTDMSIIDAYLETTDTYTIAAKSVATTTDATISLQWGEDT